MPVFSSFSNNLPPVWLVCGTWFFINIDPLDYAMRLEKKQAFCIWRSTPCTTQGECSILFGVPIAFVPAASRANVLMEQSTEDGGQAYHSARPPDPASPRGGLTVIAFTSVNRARTPLFDALFALLLT